MQIGGLIAKDRPNGDLLVQHVAAYVLFHYLYFVILLGLGLWGYLCHILLGLGFFAINICL